MDPTTYTQSNAGVGIVNTDAKAYQSAIARRKQDKYIKGLEQRISKLESAMNLLHKTVEEMKK